MDDRPAGSATASPGLRADAARNRSVLLQLAAAYVRTHGSPPPLKELARLADVGTGTVYRHFPTPRALLQGLGAEGMATMIAACRAALTHHDPAAGFRELVEAVLRGQLADPGVAAALAGPDEEPATSRLVQELGQVADAVLTRARAAGSVRPGLGADDIRRLLVGAAYGLRPVADDPRAIEVTLWVLLDGMAARTPTSSA